MDDIASLLMRAVAGIIQGVVGFFDLLHWSDRHASEPTRVGESGLEREARSWRERVFDSWYWLAFALFILAGLIGGAIWWF